MQACRHRVCRHAGIGYARMPAYGMAAWRHGACRHRVCQHAGIPYGSMAPCRMQAFRHRACVTPACRHAVMLAERVSSLWRMPPGRMPATSTCTIYSTKVVVFIVRILLVRVRIIVLVLVFVVILRHCPCPSPHEDVAFLEALVATSL